MIESVKADKIIEIPNKRFVTMTDESNINKALDSCPPGTVAHMARSTAPPQWLKANGAAISRTTYADLFEAIGTTFGAGDGSTTFNVPDLRGEFIRSWDDGKGVDTGRAFGSAQAQDIQPHTHSIFIASNATMPNNYPVGKNSGSPNPVLGGNTTSTGVKETRPRNIALLACIHY